ncbi:MAG: DUF839 domain-containing protein [Planctomycetes bacterium]|nr:DUF839 domain-containing protein [Planctomycetota bacterium]
MITRRHLLQLGGATALALLGLDRRLAGAEAAESVGGFTGYGPLIADPAGLVDLPAGFSYSVVSRAGERMDDGFLVPMAHDGMAVFALAGGKLALIRNHELTAHNPQSGPFGADNALLPKLARERIYDFGKGAPSLGGTTTIIIDAATAKREKQWLSLVGTSRNCAGGTTPWGTWVTCEEATQRAGSEDKGTVAERDHGYAFEVPVTDAPALADPTPLAAMGRFRREAIAIDPRSGAVYQTEDARDGVFYRFLPTTPGKLREGGRLQALRIRGYAKGNTWNWTARDIPVGQAMAVDWVDIADPADRTAEQATVQGAQRFTRGEGMWAGDGAIWFACTDGGARRKGQIWRYVPSAVEGTAGEKDQPGMLMLFIEPDDGALLENVDTLTVSPWGGLIAAEDNASQDADEPNRLVAVTPDGRCHPIASTGRTEWAGACFSPDGRWLFANVYGPGTTVAITGPWRKA